MSEEEDNERGGARKDPAQRKDKVIQTRVPKDLEGTLKDEAEKRRVTVSQLIRTVLEDTFHLVDNVVAESASLAESVRRDAKRIAESAQGFRVRGEEILVPAEKGGTRAQELLDSVYAWQEVLMNKEARCTRCGTKIPGGEAAYRGLTEEPGLPPVWLCGDCVDEI
ncbi:MAG: hypothetical protein KDH09_20090 [Chrysiogenetes bacterium]|nr:hypothetical protein [Chrysiogenetes bacterium]